MADLILDVGLTVQTNTSDIASKVKKIAENLENQIDPIKLKFDYDLKGLETLKQQISEIRASLESVSGGTITTKPITVRQEIKSINSEQKTIDSNYKNLLKSSGASELQGAEELRTKYNELNVAVEKLRANRQTATMEEVAGIQKQQAEVQKLISQIGVLDATNKGMANSSKEANKTVEADYVKFTTTLNKAKEAATWTKARNGATSAEFERMNDYVKQLEAVDEQYKSLDGDGAKFNSRLKEIATDVNKDRAAMKAAGEDTQTFSDKMGNLFSRLSKWFGVTQIINAIYRTVRQAVSASIELDSAFTQLKIVTGATNEQMETFVDTTAELAQSLGRSVSEVASSVETFSRLGYNLTDASELAKYATVMANVAGVNNEEATTGITSIVKGFNMDVENTEHIADVLVNVGQKYAVSASELMIAFEKSGAALNATNTSFEKSAGLIAAANASVQNASTVGTALKTVSARIRGSKSELSELGEDVEELADGFSKYAEEIKAISGVNIMVEGTTNEFKDLYDIFSDVAAVWDRLSDTQQARVSEILGGTRQLQVISSIIGNWTDATNAYTTACNSAGAATKANEIYMESAQAKINQLKASFQDMAYTLINSGFIGTVAELGQKIVSIISWISKLINLIGGLKTVFAGLGTALLVAKWAKISEYFIKIKNAMNAFRDGYALVRAFGSSISSSLAQGAKNANILALHLSGAQVAIMGIGAALSIVLMIINKIKQAEEEAIAAQKSAVQESQAITSQSAEAILAYEKYNQYNQTLDNTSEKESILAETLQTVVGALGDKASALDGVKKSSEEYNSILENIINNEARAGLSKAKTERADAQNVLSKDTNLSTIKWNYYINDHEKSDIMREALGKYAVWNSVSSAFNGEGGSDAAKVPYKTSVNESDFKELVDYYYRLLDAKERLINAGYEEDDVYNDVSAEAQKLESNVQNYVQALEKQYLFQTELNGELPKTREEFDKYKESFVQYLQGTLGVSDEIAKTIVNGLGSTKELSSQTSGITTQTQSVKASFEETDKAVKAYKKSLEEIKANNVDIDKTKFNNIDMNNRGVLDWDVENIEKYADALATWDSSYIESARALTNAREEYNEAISKGLTPEQIEEFQAKYNNALLGFKDIMGSRSTVYGGSDTFDGVEIAFSPMLQTKDGPVLLDSDTVYNYIWGLIDKAGEGWTNDRLLELDAQGLEINGQIIQGLIADIGDTAAETAEKMHYVGTDSDFGRALSDLQEIADALGVSLDYVIDNYEKLHSIDSKTTMISKFDDIKGGFDQLSQIYNDISDGGVFDFSKLVTKDFEEKFSGLGDAYQDFIDIITDSPNDINACQDAFDNLTKAYIGNSGILSDLNEENRDLTVALLEQNGVANAAEIVDQQLAVQKEKLALASGECADKTFDEIMQMYAEAEAGSITREALYLLALEKIAINENTIVTDADIDNLIALANTAANTSGVLERLQKIKQALSLMEVNAGTSFEDPELGMDINTYGFLTMNGISDINEELNKIKQEMQNVNFNSSDYYSGARYNGGGSSSKSKSGSGSSKKEDTWFDKEYKKHNHLRNMEQEEDEDYYNWLEGAAKKAYDEGILTLEDYWKYQEEVYKGRKQDSETWFEKEYKEHNHLRNMEQETDKEYYKWLNKAYKKAYKEGIITLDEYRKYQEEVFKGLRDLFKDYMNDIEHEISMRSRFDGEAKTIIKLYKTLIKKVKAEIKKAREEGLSDDDDWIQELQKKLYGYEDDLEKFENDIKDNAKDTIKDLIEFRIKMLKKSLESQRDNLKKQLDDYKKFIDKQKEMLQEQYDEEKYLEEQKEKRKSVTDLQFELNQLELDDSAWAQKRKLELAQELTDAQKDLDDFEKEHSLEMLQDELDEQYELKEEEYNKELERLEAQLDDEASLYKQALEDIRNGSKSLYDDMIAWNREFGDGDDNTVKTYWEDAYKALMTYKDAYGKNYKGITLDNATGYKPTDGWDKQPESDKGSGSTKKDNSKKNDTKKDDTKKNDTKKDNKSSSSGKVNVPDSVKKNVAKAIWNGTMGWGKNPERANRLEEVFGKNNGIQAIVNSLDPNKISKPSDEYTYANMKKKYKAGVPYKSGTFSALPGFHLIDENGTETIFESKDGNKYKMFTGGEKVLNATASKFLYEFANNGSAVLSGLLSQLLNNGVLSKIGSNAVINNITMSPITINGNADSQTVSQMRRAQRESVETILKEFTKLSK